MTTDTRGVIRRPVLTEKSMRGAENRKYTFEVDREANKLTIRDAIERVFNVTVIKVNTVNIPGRMKRRGPRTYRASGYKKATVTLAPGQKIDLETPR